MPTWLKRAQSVEAQIEIENDMARIGKLLKSSGMTSHQFAEAMGAIWTCSYCGVRNSKLRCENCGAEEVA